MIKPHKTYFISDLHLDESTPAITSQFIHLLQSCDETIDALYILGDLFEVWIGDDDDSEFHRMVTQAMKNAANKGLKIYFMHGNRDFLIGRKFLQQTGAILLNDEKKIVLYGEPVLLMHGDLLCTRDQQYLKARKLGHNRFLQFLFLSLPLKIRQKIANRLRNKSMQHTQNTSPDIMDVTQDEVEKRMSSHQVNFLIHGHTHKPDVHSFFLSKVEAKRIVLAAWHDYGSVLVWDDNGEFTVTRVDKMMEANPGS